MSSKCFPSSCNQLWPKVTTHSPSLAIGPMTAQISREFPEAKNKPFEKCDYQSGLAQISGTSSNSSLMSTLDLRSPNRDDPNQTYPIMCLPRKFLKTVNINLVSYLKPTLTFWNWLIYARTLKVLVAWSFRKRKQSSSR